jgi:hypothetical protein
MLCHAVVGSKNDEIFKLFLVLFSERSIDLIIFFQIRQGWASLILKVA